MIWGTIFRRTHGYGDTITANDAAYIKHMREGSRLLLLAIERARK